MCLSVRRRQLTFHKRLYRFSFLFSLMPVMSVAKKRNGETIITVRVCVTASPAEGNTPHAHLFGFSWKAR